MCNEKRMCFIALLLKLSWQSSGRWIEKLTSVKSITGREKKFHETRAWRPDRSRPSLIKSLDRLLQQEIIRKQISLLNSPPGFLSQPYPPLFKRRIASESFLWDFSYCHHAGWPTYHGCAKDKRLFKSPRLPPHIPIKIPAIRSYFYFQAPPERVNHVKGMTGNPGQTWLTAHDRKANIFLFKKIFFYFGMHARV